MSLKLARKDPDNVFDADYRKADQVAEHVAEHVATTIAMNTPAGFRLDPESFFDLVIDKVRDKQSAKIKQYTRRNLG